MKLRPYQRAAIDAVRDVWDSGQPNALVVLPTGTGKTVVFSVLGREMRAEGVRKILVLAHRDELLGQARDKWLAVEPGANVGIYQGDKREFWADVICASVQSCYPDVLDADGKVVRKGRINELPLSEIDLIIVDECHRLIAPTYGAVISAVREKNPDALLLGVTATPARADGKGLGAYFDRVAFRMSLADAISQGYLATLRGCRVELQIDLSTVKTTRGGDFDDNDLGRVLDTPSARDCIVSEWMRLAGPGSDSGGPDGRFTATFSPTVAAAEHLAEEFRSRGIASDYISGALAKKKRKAVLDAYQRGELRVLCNVGVLTEGWDAPHTACIVVARPTKSPVLYRQAVGRGTRLSPDTGKTDCIIMDVVGAHGTAGGLQTILDLSVPGAERVPGVDPEPEEEEDPLDMDAKQLDLPEMAQTVQIRGCTVYDIDLFGGQVAWTRIRGMRLAILDIGQHIVVYQEPNGSGFTALLIDDTAAIAIAKARPERETLAEAEQMAMVRGRAKYLKPNKFQARMPATEKQMLGIGRLVQQNVELGSFDANDVPRDMSLPQAMAWIAYLKTRRMWMRQRLTVTRQGAAA